MAKKIIMFLSKVNMNLPREKQPKRRAYTCPDGSVVYGVRTCEAPVRYLMRKAPDITEAICLMTPQARDTAWERVRRYMRRNEPNLKMKRIDIEENEAFQDGPLKKILAQVEPGDEIFLETTGGTRNNVMDLMLLSQVLSYTGVRVAGAVYSNISNGAVIEDVTGMYNTFKLVGGMQELSSFGSVSTLQDYYKGRPSDPKISELIDSMKVLKETISLCRTEKMDAALVRFNRAMDEARECEDALLKTLLPVFRKVFGDKLDIPNLVLWCAKNDMLQQALTIYKEKMPYYIVQKCAAVLEMTDKAKELKRAHDKLLLCQGRPDQVTRDYNDPSERAMKEQIRKLAKAIRTEALRQPRNPSVDETALADDDVLVVIGNLARRYRGKQHGKKEKCSPERAEQILSDYAYIRLLRNMVSHATQYSESSKRPLVKFLQRRQYTVVEKATAEDIRDTLISAVHHIMRDKVKG